jgi:hypothetical protein
MKSMAAMPINVTIMPTYSERRIFFSPGTIKNIANMVSNKINQNVLEKVLNKNMTDNAVKISDTILTFKLSAVIKNINPTTADDVNSV